MSSLGESRSLPELLKELMNDLTSLFRKEVQLAKVEATEKVQQALTGVEMVVAGAVLAIAALGVLLSALVSGLAAVFVGMGMGDATAGGLSALIIGLIVAIIAYVVFRRGMAQLKAPNLMLDRTAHSLGRDASVIKEKTHG